MSNPIKTALLNSQTMISKAILMGNMSWRTQIGCLVVLAEALIAHGVVFDLVEACPFNLDPFFPKIPYLLYGVAEICSFVDK